MSMMHTHPRTPTHTLIRIHTYTSTYSMRTSIHLSISRYINTYTYTSIRAYVHTCIHTFTYIYTTWLVPSACPKAALFQCRRHRDSCCEHVLKISGLKIRSVIFARKRRYEMFKKKRTCPVRSAVDTTDLHIQSVLTSFAPCRQHSKRIY